MKKEARKSPLLIANAGGYWGDDPFALRRQVESSLPIHYISIDFLAEITMSILQKQRARDPSAGYARDFIAQVSPLLGMIKKKGIRIITNAGGVNPRGCAKALFDAAKKAGVSLRVALIEGDDVQDRLVSLFENGSEMSHMDDGRSFASIKDRVLSANAYFGSKPVVAALAHDPDIVLCGRVTDTGITLAALIHEFGWKDDDYDRLASGIVAGHILECGAQATGGNFTDWQKVRRFQDVGYPVVECQVDGRFVVTKSPGSGGLVSVQTVREQLLYEMGEPTQYITPDVIADFTSIALEAAGEDRVQVFGVKGRAPTDFLKLSISYSDGYKSAGTLIISGPDALEKARCFADIFWTRLESELSKMGLAMPVARRSEWVGYDATHGPLTPLHRPSEILLRLSARDAKRDSLEVFRKLLPSLILSGPSGVAVTGGAPVIQDIVSYWPALLPQEHAPSRYVVLEADGSDGGVKDVFASAVIPWSETGGVLVKGAGLTPAPPAQVPSGTPTKRVPLMAIAHARSGDKGDTANIGLIGRSFEAYTFLAEHVTAERVKDAFGEKCLGEVKAFAVPNLWATNFMLEQSLGGGGTMSLHLDAQGKTFSQALLRLELDVPVSVLESIPEDMKPTSGELQP